MATTTFLGNASVLINSTDLSDQCTAVTPTYTAEALESTAMGDTARKFTAGLQNNELTLTLYQSYASLETEATVYGLVGTQVTSIVVKPTSAAVSATNPSYTLAGAYLESETPINSTYGELAMVELTFRGGTLTKATS